MESTADIVSIQYTLMHCFRPGRFYWSHEDPEIVADILFAIANVLSFARTTYVMPSHELLGPLQISLGRMLGDITRFVILFGLVSGFTITFISSNMAKYDFLIEKLALLYLALLSCLWTK